MRNRGGASQTVIAQGEYKKAAGKKAEYYIEEYKKIDAARERDAEKTRPPAFILTNGLNNRRTFAWIRAALQPKAARHASHERRGVCFG